MRLQVKLEIGHKASCRDEPTAEGFTHDWTVFVRGLDGKDISYFVEKVVFHLHESFPRAKRAVKEAPFKLDEHGYGSFELKIEVYFKSKDEPRKVMFMYDLFLPLVGYPPVTNVRTEALTFTYPSDDFMKKLLKGGAIATATESADGISNGVSNGHLNHAEKPAKEHVAQKSFTLPDGEKNKKKIKNKPSVPQGVKRPSPGHDTSIDGSVKKKKRLSDSLVSKKKSELAASLASEVKDLKIKFKPIPPREPEKTKEVEKVHHKERKEHKEHKEKTKTHSSKTKELKTPPEQLLIAEVKATPTITEHHKVKLKRDDVEKKHAEKKEKKEKNKKEKKHKVEKVKIKKTEEVESKKEERKVDLKKVKEGSDKKISKEEKKEKDKKAVNKVTIRRSSGDSWASGLMADVVSKNKALGKLLSELSDDDETEMNILPTFKTEPTPVPLKTPQKDSQKIITTEKTSTTSFTKQTNTIKDNKPHNDSTSASSHHRSEATTSEVDGKTKTDTKTSSPLKSAEKNGVNNRLSKEELYDLFEYINNCQDSDYLQKVVDVVETTGLYTVSEKTLEFDLCALEKSSLRKIQKCLGLR